MKREFPPKQRLWEKGERVSILKFPNQNNKMEKSMLTEDASVSLLPLPHAINKRQGRVRTRKT